MLVYVCVCVLALHIDVALIVVDMVRQTFRVAVHAECGGGSNLLYARMM